MTWAQRLKRLFNIDVETCHECDGAVKAIVTIEGSMGIRKILDHLGKQVETNEYPALPESRAPRERDGSAHAPTPN